MRLPTRLPTPTPTHLHPPVYPHVYSHTYARVSVSACPPDEEQDGLQRRRGRLPLLPHGRHRPGPPPGYPTDPQPNPTLPARVRSVSASSRSPARCKPPPSARSPTPSPTHPHTHTRTHPCPLRVRRVRQFTESGMLQIIDRKKDLVKLQMGEYVALSKARSFHFPPFPRDSSRFSPRAARGSSEPERRERFQRKNRRKRTKIDGKRRKPNAG